MQNSNKVSKLEVISTLKEWVSPALITIVGMLLWRDVNEMRTDIKLLLTQQSADRVKIEQLEKDVDMLKSFVYIEKRNASNDYPVPPKSPRPYELYAAVLQRDEQGKDSVKKHSKRIK